MINVMRDREVKVTLLPPADGLQEVNKTPSAFYLKSKNVKHSDNELDV